MLIYQQAGELVVFFEIDSFLPETTWSWELFADEGRQENVMIFRGQLGYRVRSTRILGHLSQGLVMSLKDFPGINSQYHRRISEVGHQTATHELLSRSLAETLGVMKWEFTEHAELVQNLGPPPPFIRPTGWFRIQDVEYDVFAPWNRNKIWYITEKLDGITMKVYKVARDSRCKSPTFGKTSSVNLIANNFGFSRGQVSPTTPRRQSTDYARY